MSNNFYHARFAGVEKLTLLLLAVYNSLRYLCGDFAFAILI